MAMTADTHAGNAASSSVSAWTSRHRRRRKKTKKIVTCKELWEEVDRSGVGRRTVVAEYFASSPNGWRRACEDVSDVSFAGCDAAR